MNNKNISDILNNPTIEIICSLSKGVLSAFPCASAISSIFSDWQNHIQYKSIQVVLTKHLNKITELESKVDKKFCNSEDYGYITLQTIMKAKDEVKEQKRELFANFLTSCCLLDNSQSLNKNMFLDLVVRMENFHILLLKVLDNEYSTFGSLYFINSHLNEKVSSNLDKYEVEYNLDYLVSLGLAVKVDQTIYKHFFEQVGLKGGTTDLLSNKIYYRTPLGEELILFLKDSLND